MEMNLPFAIRTTPGVRILAIGYLRLNINSDIIIDTSLTPLIGFIIMAVIDRAITLCECTYSLLNVWVVLCKI